VDEVREPLLVDPGAAVTFHREGIVTGQPVGCDPAPGVEVEIGVGREQPCRRQRDARERGGGEARSNRRGLPARWRRAYGRLPRMAPWIDLTSHSTARHA